MQNAECKIKMVSLRFRAALAVRNGRTRRYAAHAANVRRQPKVDAPTGIRRNIVQLNRYRADLADKTETEVQLNKQ